MKRLNAVCEAKKAAVKARMGRGGEVSKKRGRKGQAGQCQEPEAWSTDRKYSTWLLAVSSRPGGK